MSWTRRVRHPSEILAIEEMIDVMVLSVSPDQEKIALGVKQTQPNPWLEIESRYPVGSVVKGLVRNLADYGAFVQIEEGIDGLLHVSDLSWTHKVSHPSELLEKGQELDVKILSIDPAQEKVSVGLKQLEQDPWEAVVDKHPVNSDVEVEVAKLVSFGAFARLDNGIEGLIHVSEIGEERIQKPEEALEVGQKVMARVINVDPVERKIGLSIRAFLRGEERKVHAEYGQSGGDAVSVGDALGDVVPRSLIEAGRTFTEAANELMASVRANSAAPEEPATETPATAEAEPATGEPEAAEEDPAPVPVFGKSGAARDEAGTEADASEPAPVPEEPEAARDEAGTEADSSEPAPVPEEPEAAPTGEADAGTEAAADEAPGETPAEG